MSFRAPANATVPPSQDNGICPLFLPGIFTTSPRHPVQIRPNASAAQSQILAARSRSALPITDTELKLMAAAAIMGLKRIPKVG
jgi:hypothetical protein